MARNPSCSAKRCVIVMIVLMSVMASTFSIASSKSSLGRIHGIHGKKVDGLTLTELCTTSSLMAEDASSSSMEGTGTKGVATIPTSIFNLAKSIIGAGVLSLPNGVAVFADDPRALVPSAIICAVFGIAAAYSFNSIGKVCEENKARTFQEVWSKAVSPKSAWIISSSITAMCFLASLAYSIIIGDSFTSLAATFQLPALFAQRSNVILLLSSLVLFPLCAMRSLAALAPFSLLGLGGTLYTAIFMAIRLLDGSYRGPNGQFFASLPIAPSLGSGGYSLNKMTFVLLSMLSTSYIAHYNAPKFFVELKDASLSRFGTVVNTAFGVSIAFFIFIMVTGFLTFGGSTLGFILNNYASSDKLAILARFAIGLALLTGYPFTFSALREGILDLAQVTDEKQRSSLFLPLTTGLLSVVTLLALFLRDVGFVVSISGAMFGCLLMFIVPGIMNLRSFAKKRAANGGQESLGQKAEGLLNYGLIGTGIAMTVLGVYVSVAKQFGQL